jgi:hypothetical protein
VIFKLAKLFKPSHPILQGREPLSAFGKGLAVAAAERRAA